MTRHQAPGVRASYVDLTIDAGVVWVASVQGTVSMGGAVGGSAATSNALVAGHVVILLDEANQPVLGLDGEPIMVMIDERGNYTVPDVFSGRYRLAFASSVEAARLGLYSFVSDTMTVHAGGAEPMKAPTVDARLVLGMRLPATGYDGAGAASLAVLMLGVGLAAWLAADRRRRRVL